MVLRELLVVQPDCTLTEAIEAIIHHGLPLISTARSRYKWSKTPELTNRAEKDGIREKTGLCGENFQTGQEQELMVTTNTL